MAIDYSLYLLTDRSLIGSKDFLSSVRGALAGGVTLLQIREKAVSTRDFYSAGLQLKRLAAEFGVPLIVNDRLDLALALDADGLHIGQDDLPLDAAQRIIGKDKILGYSVSTVEEAVYGERMGADYLGAGPVFPSGSKIDAVPPIGLRGLKAIRQSVKIPVVGIGGIGPASLDGVKKCGVDGIAVISGILCREDTECAAKELLELWRG